MIKQEKISKKIKKMSNILIFQAFIYAVFILMSIFLFINDFSIQIFYNDFGSLFRGFQAYFIDVGQASANLIILPNHKAIVIDTGSEDSAQNFVKNVSYFLNKNKVDKIDYLILTHSDEDHVGGTSALLKKFQVNNIYRPKILSNASNEVVVDKPYKFVSTIAYERAITAVYNEPDCHVDFVDDQILFFGDEIIVQIMSCQEDYYDDPNSYSPYIFISYNDRKFLFTGDAESNREKEFLNQIKGHESDFEVDFLQVAHHGSASSSSQEFLQILKPKYAFISAADKYHPSQVVLDRLKSEEAQIFCTKNVSTIGLSVKDSGDFSIKTMSKTFNTGFLLVIIWIGVFVSARTVEYYFDFQKTKRFSKNMF